LLGVGLQTGTCEYNTIFISHSVWMVPADTSAESPKTETLWLR
jgi:hypothetical protein